MYVAYTTTTYDNDESSLMMMMMMVVMIMLMKRRRKIMRMTIMMMMMSNGDVPNTGWAKFVCRKMLEREQNLSKETRGISIQTYLRRQ